MVVMPPFYSEQVLRLFHHAYYCIVPLRSTADPAGIAFGDIETA
jgi:hypothetical protein